MRGVFHLIKTGSMLRELRESYGISRNQLEEYSQIKEDTIRKFECGEKDVLSSEKIDRLFLVLEKLNPSIELEVHVDFLRIRFKTQDVQMIIEKVLRLRMEYFGTEDRGFYGYEKTYFLADVRVMTAEREDYGTLLELTGRGCRQFEGYLEAQKRTWYEFFSDILVNELGVFKRLDLAIDDCYGILDVPFLIEKVQKNEYISCFRTFNVHSSGQMLSKQEVKELESLPIGRYEEEYGKVMEQISRLGNTLYIGTRKSDVYFCVYEKDYEQMVKMGIPIEQSKVKNRFEIRLSEDRAYNAVVDLVANEDIEKTAFSIINRYISFVERDDSKPRQRWKNCKEWELFINSRHGNIKLAVSPQKPTLDSKYRWIAEQVAPTLAMIREVEKRNGTHILEQILNNVVLDKNHMAFIEQCTLPVEQLITD